MIIVLNGPLGIGKSTLAEALAESIDQSVMLDGDHLVAATHRRTISSSICTPRSRCWSRIIGASAISTSSSTIFGLHPQNSPTCVAASWR